MGGRTPYDRPQTGASLRALSRQSFLRQGRETTQGLGKTNRLGSVAPRPKEGLQTWQKDVFEDRDLRLHTPLSSPPKGTGKKKDLKEDES